MKALSVLTWSEKDTTRSAIWRSDQVLPKQVVLADDTMTADTAYRLACAGTGLLWRSDFQNARQMLQALTRRIDKPKKVRVKKPTSDTPVVAGAAFHTHRQAQAQRTRILSQVLIELNSDYGIDLRRAPDVKAACMQAFGPATDQASVISLRSLQGVIGAFEWRKNGVEVPALGENLRIRPHYGVFSPVRGEYVQLVAKAPWPPVAHTHHAQVKTRRNAGGCANSHPGRGLRLRSCATQTHQSRLASCAARSPRLGRWPGQRLACRRL